LLSLAVTIAFFGLLVISGIGEGYCYFYPSIGTQFSSGFSERKFASLKTGMEAREVENLLGAPLVKFSRPGGEERWCFSLDKTNGIDFAWLVRTVSIKDKKVVQIIRTVAYN
jgi:outer membrane protein assembly factor BamE (lipoprotein component of BamABCDE complex)